MLLVIRLVPDNAAYIRGTRFLMQAKISKISAGYPDRLGKPEFAGAVPASSRVNPLLQGYAQASRLQVNV